MNINTYLKYNNIALIDPELEFQANCIAQYERKGYLTPKQLNSLRTWTHSPERIADLINEEVTVTPTVTMEEPKRRKFNDEEVLAIVNAIEDKETLEELALSLPNRSMGTIQTTVSRLGGYTRKGKIVGKDDDRFRKTCLKYNIIEDSTTPFD